MHRAFLDTPDGQIHYVTAGAGRPVLLLHQTPRSWDEYRDVIPLLAVERSVVAMDTIGYGESYKPARRCDIEDYGRGAIALLDGLGIRSTAIVGHHTGAVIAMELAASYPERVERLVLSSSPFMEEKVGRVRCPTLVTCGTEDPFAFPKAEIVARHIPGSRLAPIVGGTVALVDEMPEAFARLVLEFLRQ